MPGVAAFLRWRGGAGGWGGPGAAGARTAFELVWPDGGRLVTAPVFVYDIENGGRSSEPRWCGRQTG